MTDEKAGRYTTIGWPRCCGYTMLIARQECPDCNASGQLEDADGNLGGRCKHPNLPATRSLGETG